MTENAYEDWIEDVIKKFHLGAIFPAENQNPIMDTSRPLTVFIDDKAFGTDDVVAVALLKLLFQQINVVRTAKKPSEKERKALQTVWLNVSRVYDPKLGLFDAASGCIHSFDLKEYGIGLGICGQIWKEFGTLLVQKFGAEDDDQFIYNSFYREFLHILDNMSKSPIVAGGSIIHALNSFNSVGVNDPDHFLDAVSAASPIVNRLLEALVLRSNLYAKELPIMEASFTDRKDEALLVLPTRCEAVHLFLKDYDPQQEVKFIIQPRNPEQGTWQIWTVDYKRRRFHIDVPLLTAENASKYSFDIRCIHPGRFLAITNDRHSAIGLAKASLKVFLGDYVSWFKRWWWDV